MKKYLTSLTAIMIGAVGAALLSPGCDNGFGTRRSSSRLTVDLDPKSALGSRASRLGIPLTTPIPYVVTVTAHGPDGQVDTSFNGFVRLSVAPGSVQSVSGTGAAGRNVQLTNGVASNLTVNVFGAFGDARIVAEDVGYVPKDPLSMPAPQCSDGIDNDGDGLIDYPADPGCAFGNDDTETGGSYASGSSGVIYFLYPRIADVRGINQGGGATSFPNQEVQIDTGWDEDTNKFNFDTVVTRIAGDGFYATDVTDQAARGYASVFAYNFNPPPDMRVCDRLKSFGGTSADFFGFTEISYPTWELDEWDPNVRPCGVPEPTVLTAFELGDVTTMLKYTSSLVRVATSNIIDLHITSKFGPGDVPCTLVPGSKPPAYSCVVGAEASNCDLNKDGKVDFTKDPEKTCAAVCTGDPGKECTEYSDYLARGNFFFVVKDNNNNIQSVEGNGSAASGFDPHYLKGKPFGAFTGTLRYFSGGNQFTIEARCDQDIVFDTTKKPLPSDQACVFPRTLNETNDTTH
jgi:hypothetical protein